MRAIILAAICLGCAWAQDCRVDLREVAYPPLAQQARVQGAVVVRVQVDAAGIAVSEPAPSIEGHPLLTGAVRDALSRARWTGCPTGEQTLTFHFQVTDPCLGKRPLEVQQAAHGQYAITVSGPAPCAYVMQARTVRRFLFFKRQIARCEEICEPCPPR